MTPHLTDEEVLLDYYGEGTDDERARVRAHFERCAQCRALDEELRTVLQAVETTPITELPSGFEREMWSRIEPLLPVPRSGWRRRKPALYGGLALAASLAIIVGASLTVGRVWDRAAPPPAAQAVDDRAPAERLLRAEVEDHLERSQRMLVELVNTDADFDDPIASDRARAADLVAAGRLYRQSAEEIGDEDVGVLLEDLERVLVEVANAPGREGTEELTRLRQRIDDQDLVFRLRVATRAYRQRDARSQSTW